MVVGNLAPKIQFSTTNKERFYNELPWFARCSLERGELCTQPRIAAQYYPYIQANRSDMRSWMVFDLDHENPYIWQDVGLPPPNFIVSNKDNGRCHLYYAVEPVYCGENARPKPINYYDSIYKRMRKMLNADPAFGQFISKTPYTEHFRTHDLHHQEYSLGELADYVDFEDSTWLQRKGRLLKSEALGRNCAIFDELRYYAYSTVNLFKEVGNEAGFYSELLAYAEEANDFSDCPHFDNVTPLDHKELIHIVRSVANWTYRKYTGGGSSRNIKRGAMMLFKENLSLTEKQSKSASRTNAMRSKSASDAIVDATWKYLTQLDTAPSKVCMTTIAKLADVSRQTAYKYRSLITEIIEKAKPTHIISLASLFGSKSVNHGSYQVLAPKGVALFSSGLRIFKAVLDLSEGVSVGFKGWITINDSS